MYRLLTKCRFLHLEHTVPMKECIGLQTITTLKNSPIPTKSEKSSKINSDETIVVQTQTGESIKQTLVRAETMQLLEQIGSNGLTESFEVTKPKLKLNVTLDRTPLPYKEIPCPAILKFWEKYWKYVPLFGRLSWTKNITPMKYLFNEYGPIVRICGPIMGDVVMIHRPEHIAEIFKQESDCPIRSGIDILQHYRLNQRKYKLPGLFSMQGHKWLEIRSKVETPLTQQIYEYIEQIEIVCDELLQRIRNIRNRQDEVPGYFSEELSRWSMECFVIFMFNKKLGFLEPAGYNVSSEQTRFIEAIEEAHRYMSYCESGFQVWRFVDTPYSKKLYSACDVIDSIIGKYIRQIQNKVRNQLTDVKKYETTDENFSILENLIYSQHMQPEDVSTLLMDMIILGVQAITNTQAFLLYCIARNPKVQRRIYEEVMTVMPNGDLLMTEKKLENMPYLKACLKECLRMYPAFPYITRVLQETISLHGYTIPKGTFILMANQIASQREENFEDPEKFRPERWLSNNSELFQQHEYSSLPFGSGVRSCIGKNITEMEIVLLTSKILREFRVEYDYADIGSKYFMVNVPNKPLRFRFVNRE